MHIFVSPSRDPLRNKGGHVSRFRMTRDIFVYDRAIWFFYWVDNYGQFK